MDQKKKNRIIKAVIYLTVFLLILYLEIKFVTKKWDDLWFASLWDQENFNLFSYIVFRFNRWSSRIFIESTLIPVARAPLYLFNICNALFVLLLVWGLYQITRSNPLNSELNPLQLLVCACAIFLFYPLISMSEAGWIATCLNYLWPGACLLYCLVMVRKQAFGAEIPWWQMVLFVLAGLFGTNTEQTMVIATVVLVIYAIYQYHQNPDNIRKLTLLWILSGIVILQWALFIFSPGNRNRSAEEVETWFPAFADFSFLQKIDIGITTTIRTFFKLDYHLTLLFTLMIFLSYQLSESHLIDRILSAVPFIVTVTTFTILTHQTAHASFDQFFSVREGILFTAEVFSWKVYVLYAFYCAFFALIFYLLIKRFRFDQVSWAMGIAFLLGLASKAMLGFSPTVWDSGSRTAFPMLICMIFIVLILNFRFKEKVQDLTSWMIIGYSVYMYAINFAAVTVLV